MQTQRKGGNLNERWKRHGSIQWGLVAKWKSHSVSNGVSATWNSWLLSTKNVPTGVRNLYLMWIPYFLNTCSASLNTPVVHIRPRPKPYHLQLLVYHNPRQCNENIIIKSHSWSHLGYKSFEKGVLSYFN